jgi:hypothetical protein
VRESIERTSGLAQTLIPAAANTPRETPREMGCVTLPSAFGHLLLVNVMVWTAPAPASGSIESCAKMVVVEQPSEGAPSMGKSITDLSSVTTVGLDLAKHVFQVHGVDASGRVIVAKAFRKDVLAFFAELSGRKERHQPVL